MLSSRSYNYRWREIKQRRECWWTKWWCKNLYWFRSRLLVDAIWRFNSTFMTVCTGMKPVFLYYNYYITCITLTHTITTWVSFLNFDTGWACHCTWSQFDFFYNKGTYCGAAVPSKYVHNGVAWLLIRCVITNTKWPIWCCGRHYLSLHCKGIIWCIKGIITNTKYPHTQWLMTLFFP